MNTITLPPVKLLFALLTVTLLAACSFSSDEDHVRVSVIESQESKINPVGIKLDVSSATMRASITKSLVGLDEQGRVVPALAARWIVTDDGLSYIFRLGEAKWDDGRQVTAERIARLLNERISELGKSRLGDQLSVIDEAISMTGRVIEIRLIAPSPNFLQLMAQPEMALFRAGHGTGPMQLINEERGIQLGLFRDASVVKEDDDKENRWVRLRNESPAKAIARFSAGYVDVVLNGKFNHLPLIEQAGVDGNDLRFNPVAGLFGIQFTKAEGFWTVPVNREVFSMIVDRATLLSSFPSVNAWQTRLKIIPRALDVEDINTYPDWSAMTIEDRRTFARDHIRKWLDSEGSIAPLTITLPDSAGADILFLRLQSDMRQVGLDLRRAKSPKDADARLIDEIAPYDSARWFLSQLTCLQTAICLNDADDLITAGDEALDLQQKAIFYAEAEKLLVNHYNYIPLGTPVRWSLAKPDQRGFAVNSRGWHSLNNLVGIPIS